MCAHSLDSLPSTPHRIPQEASHATSVGLECGVWIAELESCLEFVDLKARGMDGIVEMSGRAMEREENNFDVNAKVHF
jgi:hypothetical protein